MPTQHKPIDLSHLSLADRIHLVQDLWDSIHDDAQAVPLTAEQKAELERRHAEMESGAVRGLPWKEVRQSLLRRHFNAVYRPLLISPSGHDRSSHGYPRRAG
jgi:putative addiction module component (TIGR02574 family)